MVRCDAAHRYWLHDQPVIGVSDALKRTGFCPAARWYTDASRDRGRDVHEATLAPDSDTDHAVRWREWEQTHDAQWDVIESPLADPVRRFAGTPDRIGSVRLPGAVRPRVVVDLKSGAAAPWHVLQAALYAHLAIVNGYGPIDELVIVYLTPQGVTDRWMSAAPWIPRALAVISAAHVHWSLYPPTQEP